VSATYDRLVNEFKAGANLNSREDITTLGRNNKTRDWLFQHSVCRHHFWLMLPLLFADKASNSHGVLSESCRWTIYRRVLCIGGKISGKVTWQIETFSKCPYFLFLMKDSQDEMFCNDKSFFYWSVFFHILEQGPIYWHGALCLQHIRCLFNDDVLTINVLYHRVRSERKFVNR
jgi:hypothetical protein